MGMRGSIPIRISLVIESRIKANIVDIMIPGRVLTMMRAKRRAKRTEQNTCKAGLTFLVLREVRSAVTSSSSEGT